MLAGAKQEGTSDGAYSRINPPYSKMTENRSGKAARDPAASKPRTRREQPTSDDPRYVTPARSTLSFSRWPGGGRSPTGPPDMAGNKARRAFRHRDYYPN